MPVEITEEMVEAGAKAVFTLDANIIAEAIDKSWGVLPDCEPIDDAIDGGWPRDAAHLLYLIEHGKDFYRSVSRAALSAALSQAAEQPVAEPEGWVLVPAEPTEEWFERAFPLPEGAKNPDLPERRRETAIWVHDFAQKDRMTQYRDLIAARPSPPCDSRTEALEVRRQALEDAIEAVKGCSAPEVMSKYVMVGPSGILAIACNAIRALSEAGRSALKEEGET